MKFLIVILVMALGICSVLAAPKTIESNDKANTSHESTGPGV